MFVILQVEQLILVLLQVLLSQSLGQELQGLKAMEVTDNVLKHRYVLNAKLICDHGQIHRFDEPLHEFQVFMDVALETLFLIALLGKSLCKEEDALLGGRSEVYLEVFFLRCP